MEECSFGLVLLLERFRNRETVCVLLGGSSLEVWGRREVFIGRERYLIFYF